MDEGVPVPRSESRIPRKALLAIVPALGLLIYNGTLMPKNGVLHVVVGASAMGFVLLVPTVLAYLIGRRSLRAATVSYCVMSGLLLLSQVGALRRNSNERAWTRFREEIQPVLAMHVQRGRQYLDEENGRTPGAEAVRLQMIQAFRRAATRLQGGARRAALGMATFIEGLLVDGKRFDAAYAELETVLPVDFAALTSTQELRRHLRIVDRSEEACRHLIEIIRTSPDRLGAVLRAEGVPRADIEGILSGFRGSGSQTRLIRIRGLDLEAMETLREMLELLHDQREEWAWNPQTQDLETDSDELKRTVLGLVTHLQAVFDEQEDLQRQQLQQLQQLDDKLRTGYE